MSTIGSMVDIVPTVLESVGLVPSDLPGRSLFDLVDDRIVLAFQRNRETGIRWPRKIVRTPKGKVIGADLEADPLELSPYRGNPDELTRWQEEVLGTAEELARWPRALPIHLEQADLDDLKALGYGGEDE